MLFLQLSPLWDFLITCLGMSYVLWNPFLFAIFNVRFQMAVREFIREEVSNICKNPTFLHIATKTQFLSYVNINFIFEVAKNDHCAYHEHNILQKNLLFKHAKRAAE